MARLLITGGAGFVGLHAAQAAVDRGHDTVLTDIRPPLTALAALARGCKFVQGDILAPGFLEPLIAGCDAVIHCAAIVGPIASKANPQRAVDVNVGGTARVLEAARTSGARVIFLSTATLYGMRPELKPLTEDEKPDPVSIYDATKLMAETLCASYRRTFGVMSASLRTGFVYGPGNSVGEYFVTAALRGDTVNEPIGGDDPCDFTYVVDVGRALVSAAERPELRESIYNVTGGRLRLRREFADIVRQHFPHAQFNLGPGINPARHLRGPCVITRSMRDFDYRPHDLESGIGHWIARVTPGPSAD